MAGKLLGGMTVELYHLIKTEVPMNPDMPELHDPQGKVTVNLRIRPEDSTATIYALDVETGRRMVAEVQASIEAEEA